MIWISGVSRFVCFAALALLSASACGGHGRGKPDSSDGGAAGAEPAGGDAGANQHAGAAGLNDTAGAAGSGGAPNPATSRAGEGGATTVNVGGEAGFFPGGFGGATDDGQGGTETEIDATAGEGGEADATPPACRTGKCCFPEIATCVAIQDEVTVVAVPRDEVLAPGAPIEVVSDAVALDFDVEGGPPVRVTVTLDVATSLVVVLWIQGSDVMVLDAAVDGNVVNYEADADGVYAIARVATDPPAACPPLSRGGPVELYDDEQVAQLRGVTEIHGDLLIGGEVTDLTPLDCLVHVSGAVMVSAASALTSLSLPELIVVGDGVTVEDVPRLTSVVFPKLFRSGGDTSLRFWGLPEIAAIEFNNLMSAPGALLLQELAHAMTTPLALTFERLANIGGDFELSSSYVDNVDGLGALRHVGGTVLIASTARSLDGIAGVQTIGGGLLLRDIHNLTRLNLGVRRVGATRDGSDPPMSLDISGRGQLEYLALPNLSSTPGSVAVGGGPLYNFRFELPLEDIGGDLTMGGPANGWLYDTPWGYFRQLRRIGGHLKIRDVTKVDFPSLSRLDGSLDISSHLVEAFSAPILTDVGGPVRISHSAIIVDLASVTTLQTTNELDPALSIVGSTGGLYLRDLVEIRGNVQVVSSGVRVTLPSLTHIRGSMSIQGGTSDFAASALTQVDGSIEFLDADGPIQLGSLETVGKHITIHGNEAATELAFGSLRSVGSSDAVPTTSIALYDLARLERIDFGNLTRVPSTFSLYDIGRSSTGPFYAHLGVLSRLGADLTLSQVHRLENTVAFSNLQAIGESLRIADNGSLTDLTGFQQLTELGGDLIVRGNWNLPTCDAQTLATELRGVDFSGAVTIVDNLSDACAPTPEP